MVTSQPSEKLYSTFQVTSACCPFAGERMSHLEATMILMVTAMQSSMDSDTVSYLGRGIYDINEVARLLRSGRARVEGWTRPWKGKSPLLTGELAGLFSFWDLLSLRVFAELTRRKVPCDHIVRGAEHLAETLDTDRPFAHKASSHLDVFKL